MKKITGSYHFNYLFICLSIVMLLSACKVKYAFNDAVIDPKVKTIKLEFIDNKASYINPQLSPKLNDKLQQKITNQTKLTRVTSDDAHYVVSGSIVTYNGTQTVGISNRQASTNRLTVTIKIKLKKNLENTQDDFEVSRSFDYSANLSFNTAEAQLLDEVVRNMVDEIFNRLFSNW
ncbi:LptE family protein [Sediminibacterium goheungense]|uniref:Lipopolysaccharide assembly protein n=1 Tax=Sediminibacterium goheungense TaxID=1086393 RepID=A0A4R6IMS6_9BACT|nr:LptE family protein [Sediminibacterium goheungense]TDO23480.1 lipopolysaccharide assembly protein [Sediminibacterium goheungense]TDO25083.1 lipopolysaccharide assembly protein [Sediminibacterium goheungense]